MNCEQVKVIAADYLAQDLEGAASQGIQLHLATCAACRLEIEALNSIWDRLGILTDVEPGSKVRSRFYSALESFQTELESKRAGRPWRLSVADWLQNWWPARPALQLALSLLFLVAGLGVGRWISGGVPAHGEIALLRSELRDMRELVTLSLLQQQSASQRLKGVSWSYQVEQPDSTILPALLETLNSDPSLNVRVAAVDALQKFASRPSIRKELVQSLLKQNSPLVQIALIDLLVQLRERQSVEVLRKLVQEESLHRSVRERAERGLRQLSPAGA